MGREVQAGGLVEHYRIEALIGRGGMGVVFLAEDLKLSRKVALKVLAPELMTEAGFRERFQQESRMAAAIDHPNIIPVYAAGESEGQLFIAMRYVPGTDLRTLIRDRSPLDPQRVLSIMRQVASALDAAHDRGLVHRDVKPANILLATDRDGREHAYLTDFGLTKQTRTHARWTATGQAVGSLDYMAPEQIRGLPVERETDIYSLGCVLHEALTGKMPFDREENLAVMYAHLHEPPPRPSARRPELGRRIDNVIARAMAKRRGDRYPTCGDLAREAQVALEIPSSSFGKLRRTRSTTARVDLHTATNDRVSGPETVTAAAPSALGQPPTHVTRRRSPRRRGVLVAAALATGLLAAAAFLWINRESPDGERTRPQVTSEILTISVEAEGLPDRITSLDWFVANPVWSPDATQIAFGANRGGNPDIYVIDVDGDGLRPLISSPLIERLPAWSPDGTRLLFVGIPEGSGEGAATSDIFALDLQTNETTQLTTSSESENGPAWSPDGRRIAFVMTDPSKGGATDLFLMNADGTGITRLTSTTPSESGPDWSPDGTRIAYQRGRSEKGDIYVMDLETEHTEKLTDTPVDESGAAFSPNGRLIAFFSNSGGDYQIFVMSVDGEGARQVTVDVGPNIHPSWSPDGTRLVYVKASGNLPLAR
jgi:serine/threonine protein kinase/Tol biopolymer transport system component